MRPVRCAGERGRAACCSVVIVPSGLTHAGAGGAGRGGVVAGCDVDDGYETHLVIHTPEALAALKAARRPLGQVAKREARRLGRDRHCRPLDDRQQMGKTH